VGGVLATAVFRSRQGDVSPPSRRPGASRRVILASLVCIGLAIATPVGVSAAASSKSEVPVIVCPTEFGASHAADVAPKTSEVDLSAPKASLVAVYTDRAGLQSVLGPRGWRCSAAYGADGNGGVTIFPKTESIGYSGIYVDDTRDLQAINADWSPACVDCILGQTCPFFARAKALYASLGYPRANTNCRRPRGELVTKDGTSSATFTDPPEVKGSATPSGGRYRALGLVYWAGTLKLTNGHVGTNGSVVVSCTVTSGLRNICAESFSYFQRQDDSKLKET
jgi:hypothetical protein